MAFGHGEHELPRHVAPEGRDTGDCSLPVRPCRTIAYAQSVSSKGDRLLVAAGSYQVRTAQEVFSLTSGMLTAQGGFDRFDHFLTQAPDRNVTTLIGVPREFRSQLQDQGFHVVVDLKGLRPPERRKLDAFHAGYAAMNANSGRVPCDDASAGEFPCNGVDLLSHVALDGFSLEPASANDIWGFLDLNTEREYAIVGLNNGVSVVDVTDAGDPFEVGHVSGEDTFWRDVKVFQVYDADAGRWRSYGYASAEAADSLVVIDLTGLPNEVSLGGMHTDNTTSHNVYVSGVEYATNTPVAGWPAPLLQVMGSNQRFGAFRSYGLSDPAAPELAGQSPAESAERYTHDATSMLVTDGRAAACGSGADTCEVLFDFSETTFDLWDLSDQANPTLLSSTSYDGASYVHSGWWSEDQRYLFVHDELDEIYGELQTTLRVFDLASLRAPVQTTVWTGPTEAVDHNGYVRGNRYYMSNYTRGLTVLDITAPGAPREVGHFDTHPVSDSRAFDGAWGAFPFLPSGSVLVSDFSAGLFVLGDRTRNADRGQIAFTAPAFGGQEGTDAVIAVARGPGTRGRVSVDYTVVGVSAGPGDIGVERGTLEWPAGDAGERTITVPLVSDGAAEPIERAFVRLSNPTGGAVLGDVNLASLFIGDPGASASVGFAERAVGVPPGTRRAIVTVRRGGSPSGAVEVSYGTRPGSARAGEDYVDTSGVLRWEDGDARPRTVVIDLLSEGAADAPPTFRVELSAAYGGLLSETYAADVGIGGAPSVGVDEPGMRQAAGVALLAGRMLELDVTDLRGPEGRPVTYDVVVDDPEVAEAAVGEDGVVVVRGLASGRVSVTVTARAGDGEDAWRASRTYVLAVRGQALVPFFASAADASREGFVRVVNGSEEDGEVRVVAIDDAGARYGPVILRVAAGVTAPFNSGDLEDGNAGKGLPAGTGPGSGDWRLELDSDLDFAVQGYVRTVDGFVTSVHDLAPMAATRHRVAIFNPGSNTDQVSHLRVVNLSAAAAPVTVTGVDDAGASPGTPVRFRVPPAASVTLTAAELEAGVGVEGALGDGAGKWRLTVTSDVAVAVMSLLATPTGHVTNLSTVAPPPGADGVHRVGLFPSASDALGRQGFVRVLNRSAHAGEVTISARDDSGRVYEPLTLAVRAGQTAPFNSRDLETGNPDKGLTGSTGPGAGDWRLELTSDLDIEAAAYIRTTDGFVTSMHEVAPVADGAHSVPFFNPGSNAAQVSLLRLANGTDEAASVRIVGTDDGGNASSGAVSLSLGAGTARTISAMELEQGGEGLEGALGDGAGKWRLRVESDQAITVMSLLSSPTGHLTNLSTTPNDT